MPPIQILYIDDDPSMLRITAEVFSGLGLHVLMASNTQEADAILSQEKVDVILCDIQLDGEDGLAYCRRLRVTGNSIPLILLSAGIDPQQANTTGATLCMSKPFDIMQLHQRILEIAGR